MSKFIDLTGKKFNHLTVVSRVDNAAKGVTRWKCLCDCGQYTVVRGANLKNGAVKSCGCLRHKKPYNRKHGLSNIRLYKKWHSMKQRCFAIYDDHYQNYGGRGITVCDEWKNDFMAFYRWAIESGENENLTLERIDVNGNYCPENCTWVDRKTQANNRTSCRIYTYKGETKNLMQWCVELGLHYGTIHSRIYRDGWSFDKAIETPVKSNGYAIRKWRKTQNVK